MSATNPVFFAVGVAGFLAATALATAVARAATRRDERIDAHARAVTHELRRVGTCGWCGSPVLHDPVTKETDCSCGSTVSWLFFDEDPLEAQYALPARAGRASS